MTFLNVSPADYRYPVEELNPFLSEEGRIQYLAKVELALVETLRDIGVCNDDVVDEVTTATKQLTATEVYEEERRIKHDIRALVNCLRVKVSDESKPFIHLGATSFDIVDTANVLRFKDAMLQVVLPELRDLVLQLARLAHDEADTVQIGRTHGQHAVPITVGFWLAGYVSRLGQCQKHLEQIVSHELKAKFSGAVGAYNASTLLQLGGREFESAILANLGLEVAEHSTQIVPPEGLARLMCEISLMAGALADLADDIRQLQRSEIGEVGEMFGKDQVGSSTMPHKRNPINMENVKSLWKVIVSRMNLVFADQLSEHQRDLTGSASGRTYGESLVYGTSMIRRMSKTISKLTVDNDRLERNLAMSEGAIMAEPLYLTLARYGHPDAHETVRSLTLKAEQEKRSLEKIVLSDPETTEFLTQNMSTAEQERLMETMRHPHQYVGAAPDRAREIAEHWLQTLDGQWNLQSTSNKPKIAVAS